MHQCFLSSQGGIARSLTHQLWMSQATLCCSWSGSFNIEHLPTASVDTTFIYSYIQYTINLCRQCKIKLYMNCCGRKCLDKIWTSIPKLHNDMNTKWKLAFKCTFHKSSILEAPYPKQIVAGIEVKQSISFFKTQRASAYSEREYPHWNCWLLFIFLCHITFHSLAVHKE